jgi:hypothetical protein
MLKPQTKIRHHKFVSLNQCLFVEKSGGTLRLCLTILMDLHSYVHILKKGASNAYYKKVLLKVKVHYNETILNHIYSNL